MPDAPQFARRYQNAIEDEWAAIALGVAPCAIGTGDASLLARILASDCLTESLVDEFVSGSNAATPLGESWP